MFVFQHDIRSLPANDGICAAYSDPLVLTTTSLESRMRQDCKNCAVPSSGLSALMSSPGACSSIGGRVQRQLKRQLSDFDEEQENISPTAVYHSDPASLSVLCDDPGYVCHCPVSKKHCRKNTDSAMNRKNKTVEDSVKGENYTSVISHGSVLSQRYGNRKALNDITVKFALNHPDDKLHELIGDFSQPYCLPFTEDDKHRDLKAISSHTVSNNSYLLHYRSR